MSGEYQQNALIESSQLSILVVYLVRWEYERSPQELKLPFSSGKDNKLFFLLSDADHMEIVSENKFSETKSHHRGRRSLGESIWSLAAADYAVLDFGSLHDWEGNFISQLSCLP
ncbi:hypothetical protein ACLOJK_017825 [Asimina triloba]